MKFSEMPYTRPDAEALKKQMSQLTERLQNAASYEEARQVFLEKEPITLEALGDLLKQRLALNKELPVYISGDAATPHGAMVAVLDYVRRSGVTKVAFNVKPTEPAAP